MISKGNSFGLSLIWHNFGTKVVSAIIAIVLWVIVLGSRNVEVTKEVPLEVIAPNDLVIGQEMPEKIHFRLSGPKAFLRTVLDRKEEAIHISLIGAKAGVVTYRFFSDNIRVPIGVKVVSIQPQSVSVRLENRKTKEVPVKVELRGVPSPGIKVTGTSVFPTTVKISGPESKVDEIKEVATLPVDLSQVITDVEKEVVLDLPKSLVQLESGVPKIQIKAEGTKASFRFKNVAIDKTFIPKDLEISDGGVVTLFVRASPYVFKGLKNTKLKVRVAGNINSLKEGVYPVVVDLPDGIELVRVSPDKVKLQKKGKK